MKIYLAGPMRGIEEFNFPAFFKAAAELRAEGHTVFSPAEKDCERHGTNIGADNPDGDEEYASKQHGFTLRDALRIDLEYICNEADAIALLPGWEHSKGADAEHKTAVALGLHVRLLPGKPPVRKVVITTEHARAIDRAAHDARAELLRARAKYGRFRTAHEGWGVIDEEWTELKEAIIANDPILIRKEAIQVAAMAMSLVADCC